MRATFEIEAKLVLLLQETAQGRGITASALLEEAIRIIAGVSPKSESAPAQIRPLPSWSMGKPLVDISNRAELYDKMEDWDKFRRLYGGPPQE